MKTEMKTLACKDMGVECDFVAKGSTNEEVKRKMMDHAGEAHPELIDNSSPEEIRMMEEKMDMLMDKGASMTA